MKKILLAISVFMVYSISFAIDLESFVGKYENRFKGKVIEHHSVEISSNNKGNLFFEGSGVNSHTSRMIMIDKQGVKLKDGVLFVKSCNLKIKPKDNYIEISHDSFCGGLGTSLMGNWFKIK